VSVLAVIGVLALVVLVWTGVLVRREQQRARRARFRAIAERVRVVNGGQDARAFQRSRPRTAGAAQETLPVPAQRRRVVCPDQPIPPAASGHTTSTGRHAKVAS